MFFGSQIPHPLNPNHFWPVRRYWILPLLISSPCWRILPCFLIVGITYHLDLKCSLRIYNCESQIDFILYPVLHRDWDSPHCHNFERACQYCLAVVHQTGRPPANCGTMVRNWRESHLNLGSDSKGISLDLPLPGEESHYTIELGREWGSALGLLVSDPPQSPKGRIL